MSSITGLLSGLRDGDDRAREQLFGLIYDELRGMARAQMKGQRHDHTLQPTALVHEAWVRMRDRLDAGVADRGHFFALAARVMRSVLIDHARGKRREKRLPPGERVPLDELVHSYEERALDLLALDEALDDLAAMDPALAALVDLRFFAGLAVDDAADALGISSRKAARDWCTARAWLYRRLS